MAGESKSCKTDFGFSEAVSFTIELTIPNFSALKAQTTTIASDKIPIGPDYVIALVVCPLKQVMQSGSLVDFVSMGLEAESTACSNEAPKVVTGNFSIVDPVSNISVTFLESETEYCGEGADADHLFLKHCSLWGPAPIVVIKNDPIKFRAKLVMEATGNGGNGEKGGNNRLTLAESLQSQYRRMYESQVGRDFTLVSSDGTERPVHKAVLSSASTVFERMLESDLAECTTGRCAIPDVDTAVLDTLLQYMYYGCLDFPETECMIMRVMRAADKYDLVDLEGHCEKLLCGRIREFNAEHLVITADAVSAFALKNAAIQYMAANFDECHMDEDSLALFQRLGPALTAEVRAALQKMASK